MLGLCRDTDRDTDTNTGRDIETGRDADTETSTDTYTDGQHAHTTFGNGVSFAKIECV